MKAIITGATSGIGRAIALRLARDQWSIATISRDAARLEQLEADVREIFPQHESLFFRGDLLNEEDCTRFTEAIREQAGFPNLIVNCAGLYHTGRASQLTEEQLMEQLQINFFSAFRATQPWVEDFKQRRSGTIISIGSIVSREPRTGAAAYSLSKQLLDGWMRLLADELRDAGVKVCRIIPGSVNTPSWDGEPEALRSVIVNPEEIAEIVSVLLSLPPESWMEEVVIRPLMKNR